MSIKNMINIICLGNPEKKYELTRHNIGFRIADRLAEAWNVEFTNDKYMSSEVAKGAKVSIFKPSTYVNNSGVVAAKLKEKRNVELNDIWVVHDEVEIPFGEIRVKQGGASGGHNGIKSIDEAIGADYWRVRIGVGRDERFKELSDFVLSPFTESEETELPEIIDQAVSYLIQSLEDKEIKPITFNAKKEHKENIERQPD